MTKLKNPLLSIGARGTIADSLTFQKRGRTPFVRQKPIPKDPKSPAQLAQRQRYRDAVDAWNLLSEEQREAWRGVCPGLTAYQCFIRSELKYAPPPIPIDIGAPAIQREWWMGSTFTTINKENPANASGIITSIEIFVENAILTGVTVGTFYTTNANTLKCRASQAIGTVSPGAKRTFDGLSIAVQTGDFIGIYATGGLGFISGIGTGYAGIWYINEEHIDPGDEATYTYADGDCVSLYGTGE